MSLNLLIWRSDVSLNCKIFCCSNDQIFTSVLPPSFFSCSCSRPLELPPEWMISFMNHLNLKLVCTWDWDLTGTGIVLPYLLPPGKTQTFTHPISEMDQSIKIRKDFVEQYDVRPHLNLGSYQILWDRSCNVFYQTKLTSVSSLRKPSQNRQWEIGVQAAGKLRRKKASVGVPSWDGGAGDVGPRMRTRRQINGRPEHSPLVHTAAARGPIYRSPY